MIAEHLTSEFYKSKIKVTREKAAKNRVGATCAKQPQHWLTFETKKSKIKLTTQMTGSEIYINIIIRKETLS